MAEQYWMNLLPQFPVANGTALANTTTLTDISPGAAVAGNVVDTRTVVLTPGTKIHLKASGFFSTTTGPPNILLGFYYGGVAGVALAASSAFATTASLTNVQWAMEYWGTIFTTGTAGSIQGKGYLDLATSLTALTHRPIPETANQSTVAIDTSVVKSFTVGAQWGTASPSNTITCDYFHAATLN
jgi:hypothetical protein